MSLKEILKGYKDLAVQQGLIVRERKKLDKCLKNTNVHYWNDVHFVELQTFGFRTSVKNKKVRLSNYEFVHTAMLSLPDEGEFNKAMLYGLENIPGFQNLNPNFFMNVIIKEDMSFGITSFDTYNVYHNKIESYSLINFINQILKRNLNTFDVKDDE